jgi:hypothetical protein
MTKKINEFRSNIIGHEKVKYMDIKTLIDNDICARINTEQRTNLQYCKFRVSNNDNNADAAHFHRDTMLGNKFNYQYTCILYLDDASVELIPGTHKQTVISRLDMFSTMKKAIQFKMQPGDLIIFHSNLFHRGIFSKQQKNRRVLQIFDCAETAEHFQYLLDNTYNHVVVGKENKTLIRANRAMSSNRYTAKILGLGGVYTNLNNNFVSKLGIPSNSSISSEGNKTRIKMIKEPQVINNYCINVSMRDLSVTDQKKVDIMWIMKNSEFYAIIIICIICILYICVISVYCNKPILKTLIPKTVLKK